jgi:hypothetical protein
VETANIPANSVTVAGKRMPLPVKIRFSINILIILVFAAAAREATDFVSVSRYLPQYAGTAGALIGVMLLIIDVTKYRRVGLLKADEAIGDSIFAFADAGSATEMRAKERETVRRALEIWGYLFGFLALIAMVGLTVGTAVWLAVILRFLTKFPLRKVLISVVVVVTALQIIRSGMNLIFPTYFLEQWVTLDFPM